MSEPFRLEIRQFAWNSGAAPLFSGLDIELPRGRVIRLRGPSGCGKSTLLAILSGEIPAQTPGCIFETGEKRLPEVHGRSSQDPFLHLVTTTVLDELLLGPEFRETTWQAAAEHAMNTAARFGLEPTLRNAVDRLSFGQARYLGLACMWQYPPELLLLDEPLTGLDVQHRSRILDAMRLLAERGTTVVATEASLESGDDVVLLPVAPVGDVSPPPAVEPPCDDGPLRFERLRWNGGPEGFALDVDLGAGSMALVTGPNGCGKTQLLRCIAGLGAARSGTIVGPARRAFVPQHPDQELFAPDVMSEMTLGRDELRPAAEMLAGYLGLHACLGRSPLLLSYGEKRRVSLAGALLRRPAVLLLDEPLGGLDQTNRARISALMSGYLASGGRIVAATHEPEWFAPFSHRRIDLEELTC